MGVHREVSRRAVFLDRDGVLNAAVVRGGKPFPPASVDEVALLPGVPEALARLREAGFVLLVATNQPDVARGAQTREAVEAIHAHMLATLPLDAIYACFHDDVDHCACRKPLAGMLLAGAHAWDIDLPRSVMVGDRWRDIAAGVAAGCRTAFVDYGYDERQPPVFDKRVTSLAEAAAWILEGERPT